MTVTCVYYSYIHCVLHTYCYVYITHLNTILYTIGCCEDGCHIPTQRVAQVRGGQVSVVVCVCMCVYMLCIR